MATLEEVKDEYKSERVNWSLYGCTAEWQQKVNTAFRQIGDAIMQEQGVDAEQASQLPPNTPLGPKAEAAYQAFCALLESDEKRDEQ